MMMEMLRVLMGLAILGVLVIFLVAASTIFGDLRKQKNYRGIGVLAVISVTELYCLWAGAIALF
jgi:hypothetical protein